MNLRHLTDEELDLETKSAAEKERLATLVVLWHLRENERRMLYAKRGYRDLKSYCVHELKFSEGSAWRRIATMRLLREIPETENKFKDGDLTLTQISLVQTFFRQEKKTVDEKRAVLASIEGQTIPVTQRVLAEQGMEPVEKIKERPVKGGGLEITLVIDEELQRQLEEIEILVGKKMSKTELLQFLAKQTLASLKRKAQPSGSHSVTIRKIKQRDQYRCQYRDPQTGRQCTAQHHLQIEHIQPRAKGGNNDLQNLQLLCANHNRLRAVQEFGATKMRHYVASLE